VGAIFRRLTLSYLRAGQESGASSTLRFRCRWQRRSLGHLCETRAPIPIQTRKCLYPHTFLLSFASEPKGQVLQFYLRRLDLDLDCLLRMWLGCCLARTWVRQLHLEHRLWFLRACSRRHEEVCLQIVRGKSLWHRSNLSATSDRSVYLLQYLLGVGRVQSDFEDMSRVRHRDKRVWFVTHPVREAPMLKSSSRDFLVPKRLVCYYGRHHGCFSPILCLFRPFHYLCRWQSKTCRRRDGAIVNLFLKSPVSTRHPIHFHRPEITATCFGLPSFALSSSKLLCQLGTFSPWNSAPCLRCKRAAVFAY
jgi:hypothetical protein